MALYELKSERKKTNFTLMTQENIPETVTYVTYAGLTFERDLTIKGDGKTDPYSWMEHSLDEPLVEGAVAVDGKSLICTTDLTTTSAQRRGLNRREGGAVTELAIEMLQVQIAELQAKMAAPSQAELELASIKKQLVTAGIEVTADPADMVPAGTPAAGDEGSNSAN